MIKEKFNKEHRRNKSELHSVSAQPSRKSKKKDKGKTLKRPSTASHRNHINADLINSLVAKSMRNVPQKQVIIEDIQEDSHNNETVEEFFRFGKRNLKGLQFSLPEIEEIAEVPDTGSYSQRNTESRPENKQNARNLQNIGGEETKMKISLQKLDYLKGKEAQSHRAYQNSSHRSQSKTSRSHNCSQSTVQLRSKSGKLKRRNRGKGSDSNKIDGLERQVKLIWQFVGEIWLNSKAIQKVPLRQQEMNQDNSVVIQELARKSKIQEKDLLELKLHLSRIGKGVCFQ